jgi:ribosomal protein S18 acetylase RimI-like enzyme
MLTIVQAETEENINHAREMMLEYARSLGFDLCFQGFEEELRLLPGKYAPPAGRLFLAFWDERPAGVIALRAMEESGACEMKRLYVRPEFRGHQIGRKLAEYLIQEGPNMGYSRMRLDTVPGNHDHAIAMYRELGFREVVPYYKSPVDDTLFMELALDRSKRADI